MATPDHQELGAGALRADYDYDDGDLKNIRYGDLPVLDRLYVRIRAANWATEPMRSRLVTAERSRLISHLRWGGADPWATGTLTVRASPAELHAAVEIEFRAQATIQRAGLNLHHPLDSTVGRPLRWGNGDLSHAGEFPLTIYPQYADGSGYLPMIGPFDQLAVQADAQTELVFTFAGARFETEDQRNWTDASFKTYGPPVDGLRPRRLEAGSRVAQHVLVRILGSKPLPRRKRHSPAAITIGADPAPPTPPIGATATSPLPDLPIDHVRAEVRPDDPGATGSLRRLAAMLREQGIALELALRIGKADASQLAAVLRAVTDVPLRGLAALGPATKPTPAEVTALVRACADAGVRVAAGTAGHFSEINRARELVRDADLVVWSTNPQVHASDDATVMAGAAIVGQTVASAARIWPGKPVAVSPVRLGPAEVADPRAEGPFAAAWLVAVLAGLAGTRCEWITVDLPLSNRAVCQVLRAVRRSRDRVPAEASSAPGLVPVAAASPPGLVPVEASSPDDPGLAVLATRRAGGAWLLVAELDGRDGHTFTVPGKIATAEILGGPHLAAVGQERLTLGPHEVAAVSVAL